MLIRLRAETAAAHQRLEESLGLVDRLASTEDYRRLIEGFWGLYAGIEPRLAPLIRDQQWPLQWELRRKLPLIEKDLRVLGASSPEIAGLPVCEEFPSLASQARVLGVLYVLEGSTLGGQHISKLVETRLRLGPANGAAFFNGYGRETGSMWKKFCAVITEWAPGGFMGDEMVFAAVETFETFRNWLCHEPQQVHD